MFRIQETALTLAMVLIVAILGFTLSGTVENGPQLNRYNYQNYYNGLFEMTLKVANNSEYKYMYQVILPKDAKLEKVVGTLESDSFADKLGTTKVNDRVSDLYMVYSKVDLKLQSSDPGVVIVSATIDRAF